MFWLSKKDGNELFDRLRTIENKVSVNEEHDSNLEKLFMKHDKDEMLKYDSIQKTLNNLSRNQNYVIGALIIFEFLHKFGIISF